MMAELSSFYHWNPDRFKQMSAREFLEWYESANDVIKNQRKVNGF